MKKEEKKVPQLRFPKFAGDWEQRKLPEFVSFFNGLTYTPDDVEETGTLVLRSSNVKNGEIVDADNVYVNDKVVTSENVQKGDIIVVVRNGSRALIGKHAQIKASMPNTVIGAFMSGMRSEHSSFVNALLDTSAFENEIAKNMGATINQITGYMFSKMEFMIPSGEEQQKIGEYFQSLDHLITLHQRKLEKIKEFKKGVMQKLFSQEVRFKADDESEFPEWEEKTFHEVIKLYRGSSPRPIVEYIVDDNQGLNWIKISDVPQNGNVITTVKEHISKEGAEKSRAVYKGEIILSNSMSFGKPCILGIDGFIHDGWFVIREYEKYLNKWYLCQLLNSDIMYKQYRRLAAGGVVLNISSEIVNSTKIPVPCLAEQQKIADCLSSLDEVIEKQKAALAAWKELKKGLLQQMFV